MTFLCRNRQILVKFSIIFAIFWWKIDKISEILQFFAIFVNFFNFLRFFQFSSILALKKYVNLGGWENNPAAERRGKICSKTGFFAEGRKSEIVFFKNLWVSIRGFFSKSAFFAILWPSAGGSPKWPLFGGPGHLKFDQFLSIFSVFCNFIDFIEIIEILSKFR